MRVKSRIAAVGAAGLLAATMPVFPAGALLVDVPARDAAAFCQSVDDAEEGFLAGLGLTRGECVNVLTGPSTEQSNNTIAAFCGADVIQGLMGVSTKGQCVKVLRSFRV